MEKIKWILNQMPKNEDKNLAVMALDNVNQARKFHRSFPQYSVTPLAKLDGMAGQLGLGGLFVKDESYRFGLNAFKVLGGSFAMAKYIAKEMGKDVSAMTLDRQHSLLQQTEIMDVVLHGQQISLDRKPLYICQREAHRQDLIILRKKVLL